MDARKEVDLYLIDNENVSTFVKLYERYLAISLN